MNHTWSALLRYHGEWGVEAQLFRDLEFLYGRRWPTREEAERHAGELGENFLTQGGTLIG